jgi:hypothetical protein
MEQPVTPLEPLPIFNDTPNASDENCAICMQSLHVQQHISLPHCKHTFHSACILEWFRSGAPRCPLCNDTTTQIPRGLGERYKLVRAFSRRKNAPTVLKTYVNRLKKTEKALVGVRRQLRELNHRHGIFNEMFKERSKLKQRVRTLRCRERRYRRLLGSLAIVPLYI